MKTDIISARDFAERIQTMKRAYHEDYYAMYSSLFGGIVTDPLLMLLPLDDHVVHRGDGVFESVKCVHGKIYNLRSHLERLCKSAEALQLAIPAWRENLEALVIETIQAGAHPDCCVRVLVTRGPGGLGANPYECSSPQLYIMAYKLGGSFMTKRPEGARVEISRVPPKNTFFAQIKSCNYLPNVLMAREAVDCGADFMAAFDEQGFLTECATENIGMVTKDGELLTPNMGRILAGTTMRRVLELADVLVRNGGLKAVRYADITVAQLHEASEVLVFGTTRDVTAVVLFDGRPVADGKPGRVYALLSDLLHRDIYENEAMQTPCF
ncbi:MAG: aminotransferase class IV [Kiritimatiellae bacterium]|nr:aminotransferase class IV [Kiritimatiellia bacterium]